MPSFTVRFLLVLGMLCPVLASAVVAMVSAGANHTVALKSDGTPWGWGGNNVGQLGDGSTIDRYRPVPVAGLSGVAPLAGLSGVVAVAAGELNTLALNADGSVLAWGLNDQGQLGDGGTTERHHPAAVPGLSGVVAVAAGRFHSVALKASGTLLAWGGDSYGQLGDGASAQRRSPVPVPGLSAVVAVSAGQHHTVALKRDGGLAAWGLNDHGQLGDGSTTDRHRAVAVAGLGPMVAVSAGYRHTVALRADGSVFTWGMNDHGQLGDGTVSDHALPAPVPGLSGVVAVAAGRYHTVALKADGTLMAWGGNSHGQLGDGSTSERLTPQPVPGLAGVLAVAAGQYHTVAMTAGETLIAWGWNDSGQLGDGSTAPRLSAAAAAAIKLIPRQNQTVAFGKTPATVALHGIGVLTASASSALPVSFQSTTPAICTVNGSIVTGIAAGSCSVVANQAGDSAYAPAQAALTIKIGKALSSVTCDTQSALSTVNTCLPDVTLHIAGSAAFNEAIGAWTARDLFDASIMPVIKVVDGGSASALADPGAVTAWLGVARLDGLARLTLVVVNNTNGAGSGVSQLLGKADGTIAEADVVRVGPGQAAAGSCSVNAASTVAGPVVDCLGHAVTPVDLAISDVAPQELYRLYASAKAALDTVNAEPLALQGFGIGVNARLYAALQERNVADQLLPAWCSGGDPSAACQPSIRRADYAGLASVQSGTKSAAALLGNGDPTVLTLARFDALSGIQSASNIFFLNNACGINADSKGKRIAGVLGGALDPVGEGGSTAALVVSEKRSAAAVVAALNGASGYAIGALSLTSAPAPSDSWKFVRIDGVSPDHLPDGALDGMRRKAMSAGAYPFAMLAFAVTPAAARADKAALTAALVAALKDPAQNNHPGIAYPDDRNETRQSKVHRPSGNNCSPLTY